MTWILIIWLTATGGTTVVDIYWSPEECQTAGQQWTDGVPKKSNDVGKFICIKGGK